MKDQEILNALFAPFQDKELEWKYWSYDQVARDSDRHRIVPSINAMAVRKRLDEVVGPFNWKEECAPGMNGVVCTLSVCVDGRWIVRSNYGEKSANTAFARAAADLGIGRYLYDLPIFYANYVLPEESEGAREIEFHGRVFYHIPPSLDSGVKVQPKSRLKPTAEDIPLQGKNEPINEPTPQQVAFNQAPLGNKAQIDQMIQAQKPAATVSALVPKTVSAESSKYNPAPPPKPESDDRPYAFDKLRFGNQDVKGKAFRDITYDQWVGLIKWMNENCRFPEQKAILEDRKKMMAFLDIKINQGVLDLPSKEQVG